MKLTNAPKERLYVIKSYLDKPQVPADFKRRGLGLKSIFTYAGEVGQHYVLKFGGMRIAIHATLAKDLEVEECIHENRPRR
jgi:hypothetical protein